MAIAVFVLVTSIGAAVAIAAIPVVAPLLHGDIAAAYFLGTGSGLIAVTIGVLTTLRSLR